MTRPQLGQTSSGDQYANIYLDRWANMGPYKAMMEWYYQVPGRFWESSFYMEPTMSTLWLFKEAMGLRVEGTTVTVEPWLGGQFVARNVHVTAGGFSVVFDYARDNSGQEYIQITSNDGLTIYAPNASVYPTDLIFADGFEAGNLSAWSGAVTDGGDLSVTGEAALVGESGMQAMIDDNRPMYVRDVTPDDEARYRARFYFDPNSITMAQGDDYYLFVAYSDGVYAFAVRLLFNSGDYRVQSWLRDDGYTYVPMSAYTISDAPHFIELDWQAASAPEADDGHFSLWIDGELKQTLSDLDTDTKLIDEARLGPWAGIDAGTQGTCYFDAFESPR
jgi:hypothetical protein